MSFKMRRLAGLFLFISTIGYAQLQQSGVLNEPPDISKDFKDVRNTFYVAENLTSFNPDLGEGIVRFTRYNLTTRQAFNNMLVRLAPVEANEFPATEYEKSPGNTFSISFTSPRTLRIKVSSGPQFVNDETSLMMVDGKAPIDNNSWAYTKIPGGHQYQSEFGKVVINEAPWKVSIYDEEGKLLTQTLGKEDVTNTYTPVTPFSYIRRASDYSRSMDAVFSLLPGEKIFGCGEVFWLV